MPKKVLKLDFEGDFEFALAGMLCGYKDYRLCFELNLALNLNFERNDDISLSAGRPGSSTRHSYYSFNGPDNEVYHILSNRDKGNTGFYIPEMKNVDYFLLITGASPSFDVSMIISTIRNIEIISGIYEINPKELKSADSFLIFTEN